MKPWRRLPTTRRTTLALAAALVIATLPYWEVLLGRRTAMFGDVNDLFVPSYVAVWRIIRAGHLPVWTPAVFAGHSIVGAGQFGVFYPLNVLFGFLEPVNAYRWWLLLHVWIAAAGAFAWSWSRFRSHAGAVVSAVAYSGSGFAVLHLVNPAMVIGMAWLPAVFYGVDKVRERWTARRAALAAVPLAMIALGGHPQMLWIALTGVAVYVVVLGAIDRRTGPLLRAAGAVALGLGIAAVQLLPLWEFSRTSQRPSLPMKAAFDLSALPHDLLTLVFPWLFGGSTPGGGLSTPWRGGDVQHEVGMFAGATIVALAVVAVVWRHRAPVVRALLAVALLSVLLALGRSTPFGRLFYDVLPGARDFRAWARTILLLNVAVAMLAGAGVREARAAPRRAVVVLSGAFAALVVAAVGIPSIAQLREFLVGGVYGAVARGVPVALLLGLIIAVAIIAVRPRFGTAALVIVCSIEVVTFVHAAEWHGLSAPAHDLHAFYDKSTPPSFGRPYNAPGGIDRWLSDTYGFRLLSLVKDLHGVNGYDPLIQKEWADTAAGFTYDAYPTRPDFWRPGWLDDVLRVTTLVLNDKIVPSDPTWRRAGPVSGVDMTRWERAPRLPEAYLAGGVKIASLATIRRALVDPAAPLMTTAFVERGVRLPPIRDTGPPGQVQSADVLGSGRAVVDASRATLLVLSHDWEAGWHATIDGHATPVVRTNGLVLGVPVPAGHHVVEIGYRPPGLVPGALITFGSLLLLVGGPAAAGRIRRIGGRRRRAHLNP